MSVTASITRPRSLILLGAVLTAGLAVLAVALLRPAGGHAQQQPARTNYPVSASAIGDLNTARGALLANLPTIDTALLERALSGQLDAVAGGSLSTFQRNIISDGTLTLSEYTAAQQAYYACMSDAGVEMPAMRLDGVGRYNDGPVSGTHITSMQAAYHDCSGKYTSFIDLIWGPMTSSLGAKVAQVQSAAYTDCLAQAGYSRADVNSAEADAAAGAADQTCISSIEQATNTPVFLGG